MATRPHHSIGEVLSLLQGEHSDVTISKIRFLESQGLIDPERTPSGYRKFYPSDIARLRWILLQQRDHFLPLKVIKQRLEDPDVERELESLLPPVSERSSELTLFAKRDKSKAEKTTGVEAAGAETTGAEAVGVEAVGVETAGIEAVVAEAVVAGIETEVNGDESEKDPLLVGISATELAEAAEIDIAVVRELDRAGLIVSLTGSGSALYDPNEALSMAKAAAVFGKHGFEPRHLRMFKVSAERQAGALEQVFSSRLNKGGDSMRQAQQGLNELVRLGEQLQRLILHRSFGEHLDQG